MRVYKPNEAAPDFIKANIVISVTDFTNWLEQHATPEGSVRLVVKESKGGKYYASLDHFVSPIKSTQSETDINPTDLPF